jgi:hypothetical protein
MLLRMAASSKDKRAIAARAWKLLFDFFASTRPDRDRTLESRNLTANDSRALMSLHVEQGKTMGMLARDGAVMLRMPRGWLIGSSGLAMRGGAPARPIGARNW